MYFSAHVSRLISACQPLDHRLISCVISAYSAALLVPVSRMTSTCQQLDQDPQPSDKRLSTA